MLKQLHKRILCLSLVVLLVFAVTAACADTIDLAAMTDDELTALLTQVNDAITARGIEKTATLPKGTYIAGKDIPVGSYVYTCLAVGDDWGNVTIYSDEGEGKQLMWHVVTAPDQGGQPETIFIKLNAGDQLKSGVPFSLTIAAGIMFR